MRIKTIFITAISLLAFSWQPSFAKKPNLNLKPKDLEMGFAFYVGGFHLMDAKAKLTISGKKKLRKNSVKKYIFDLVASTTGITNAMTDFIGKITSSGTIYSDNSVKSNKLITKSSSNFGDKYSILTLSKDKVLFKTYPDHNEESLQNLPGNPLKNANDPLALLINMMSTSQNTGSCGKNKTFISNYYLYTLKVLSSTVEDLEVDSDYNVASGKALACEVKFARYKDKKKLPNPDAVKREASVFYFKTLKGIPYSLPVLTKSKDPTFGWFFMHLQYVKYGNIVYKANEWSNNESFTKQKLDDIKKIENKLTVKQ